MEKSLTAEIMSTVEKNIAKYGRDNIYCMSRKDRERAIKVKFADGKEAYFLNKKPPKKKLQYVTPQGDYMYTIWGELVFFIKGGVFYNECGDEIEIL